MPIPVVETTAESNQTTNATSKTDVTSPSGVLADDIVLIFIAMDGDAANPEANADGFATLTSFPEGADEIYVLWKRSTGGEPANYTVNWTGNEQARFMTVRVSGCITTGDPWDIISAGVSNAGSVDNVIDRLTSTVIKTLALYGCAVDRNRVDAADTITGTGWTEVGISGSSGGANGVGLIVGQNDMPAIEQVEAGTFGTWASDQNASRGFNLKGISQTKTFSLNAILKVLAQQKTFTLDGEVLIRNSDIYRAPLPDQGNELTRRDGDNRLVRVGNDLYCLLSNENSTLFEMYKSTDDGVTWAIQDSGNGPANGAASEPTACDVDSAGLISMITQQGVEAKYQTFNTSTDLWGTQEDITSDAIGPIGVAMAVDNSDIAHALWYQPTPIAELRYSNRIGGTWKTPVTIDATSFVPENLQITFQNNIPVVMEKQQSSQDFKVRKGNQNDATSFGSPKTFTSVSGFTLASLVRDKFDFLHIGFANAAQIRYSTQDPADGFGTWSTEEVIATPGTLSIPSLTLLGDSIEILWSYDSGGNHFLKRASKTTGSFVVTDIIERAGVAADVSLVQAYKSPYNTVKKPFVECVNQFARTSANADQRVYYVRIDDAMQFTKTFTLDARLVNRIQKTFTLDAILTSDVTVVQKTFTLDGILKAVQQKLFTLDAILKATFQKTFTLDARLVNRIQKTFTLDSILKAVQQKTFTLGAALQETFQKTFTMDAVLAAVRQKIFTLDAILKATQQKTFTLNAALQATFQKTFSLNAILKATQQKTFTLDGVLKATQQKIFTLDAILESAVTTVQKTFTLNAILKAKQQKTFTIDAVLSAPPSLKPPEKNILQAMPYKTIPKHMIRTKQVIRAPVPVEVKLEIRGPLFEKLTTKLVITGKLRDSVSAILKIKSNLTETVKASLGIRSKLTDEIQAKFEVRGKQSHKSFLEFLRQYLKLMDTEED